MEIRDHLFCNSLSLPVSFRNLSNMVVRLSYGVIIISGKIKAIVSCFSRLRNCHFVELLNYCIDLTFMHYV